MKRPKYYYCAKNGLIYRNWNGQECFLYSRDIGWSEGSQEFLTISKNTGMSPISPQAVKFFIKDGGYTPHFRTLC